MIWLDAKLTTNNTFLLLVVLLGKLGKKAEKLDIRVFVLRILRKVILVYLELSSVKSNRAFGFSNRAFRVRTFC